MLLICRSVHTHLVYQRTSMSQKMLHFTVSVGFLSWPFVFLEKANFGKSFQDKANSHCKQAGGSLMASCVMTAELRNKS